MKLYSTQELMDCFRVSRYAIYRANKSGALPITKREGTQNYYSEADVINFLKQSSEGKTTIK
jgi:hypothetical protein